MRYLKLFVVVIFLSSCKNKSMIEQVTEFKKFPIIINVDSMYEISRRESVSITKEFKYVFVMYVDSLSCSMCVLKEMNKWELYMDSLSEHKCVFYPIFSPKRQDKAEFEYKVKALNISFPIYVDTAAIFERTNPKIKNMRSFNTFMLDDGGNVLIIGNPTKNKRIEELVDRFLKKHDYGITAD